MFFSRVIGFGWEVQFSGLLTALIARGAPLGSHFDSLRSP